jgi:hypothetical protein
MSYGFSCKNQDSITQIDENYSNYHVVERGTRVQGFLSQIGDFPLQEDADSILFIRPYANNLQVLFRPYYGYYNGGRKILFFVCHCGDYRNDWTGDLIGANIGSSTLIEYIKVRENSVLPKATSGYGMEVYKANNTLAFTSSERVVKFVTKVAIQSINSLLQVTVPASIGTGSKKWVKAYELAQWSASRVLPASTSNNPIKSMRAFGNPSDTLIEFQGAVATTINGVLTGTQLVNYPPWRSCTSYSAMLYNSAAPSLQNFTIIEY